MEDAVEQMALFHRFVLNILKQSQYGAQSQRNKLKKAGWNDEYRAQLFLIENYSKYARALIIRHHNKVLF
jgi:hypothetical protein